jgi:uncharacterized membrane protein YqgA involved in biofilm formation
MKYFYVLFIGAIIGNLCYLENRFPVSANMMHKNHPQSSHFSRTSLNSAMLNGLVR